MSKKQKVCGEERGVSWNGRGPSSPLTSGGGRDGDGRALASQSSALVGDGWRE